MPPCHIQCLSHHARLDALEVIMNRLAQEAVSQIGGFKAAEITMLTWAYAAAGLTAGAFTAY